MLRLAKPNQIKFLPVWYHGKGTYIMIPKGQKNHGRRDFHRRWDAVNLLISNKTRIISTSHTHWYKNSSNNTGVSDSSPTSSSGMMTHPSCCKTESRVDPTRGWVHDNVIQADVKEGLSTNRSEGKYQRSVPMLTFHRPRRVSCSFFVTSGSRYCPQLPPTNMQRFQQGHKQWGRPKDPRLSMPLPNLKTTLSLWFQQSTKRSCQDDEKSNILGKAHSDPKDDAWA